MTNYSVVKCDVRKCLDKLSKQNLITSRAPLYADNITYIILGKSDLYDYEQDYASFYNKLTNGEKPVTMLNDGGVIFTQFYFNKGQLVKGSHSYYPNPGLPLAEEFSTQQAYQPKPEHNPTIRIDFDRASYRELVHPKIHTHLGQFCGRILNSSFPLFSEFVNFVLFLTNEEYWIKFNNKGRMIDCSTYKTRRIANKSPFAETLTGAERTLFSLKISE